MGAILGGLFSALFSSVASLLSAWFAKKEYQQEGRTEQSNADLAATTKEAKNAAAVQTDVAKLSDSAVDDGLRTFSRFGR